MFILFLGRVKNSVSEKKEDEECENGVEIYKALLGARICLGSVFCRRMLRGVLMINGATGMLSVV